MPLRSYNTKSILERKISGKVVLRTHDCSFLPLNLASSKCCVIILTHKPQFGRSLAFHWCTILKKIYLSVWKLNWSCCYFPIVRTKNIFWFKFQNARKGHSQMMSPKFEWFLTPSPSVTLLCPWYCIVLYLLRTLKQMITFINEQCRCNENGKDNWNMICAALREFKASCNVF